MASPHYQHDDLATADGDPMSPAAHSDRMNRDEHTPSDAPPVALWRVSVAYWLRDRTVQGLLKAFALGVVLLLVSIVMPDGVWRDLTFLVGLICTYPPTLMAVLAAGSYGGTVLIKAIADRLDGGHR